MNVQYSGITRDQIPDLADRLEAEPYPKRCHVVLLEGLDGKGHIQSRDLRLEIAPHLPGVLVSLDSYSVKLDWVINELIELAKTRGAP